MTDPRDTMLAAARALHERGENDPGKCDTCTDPAGINPVYWPCPTAVALGATGRSEWANTPPAVAAAAVDPRCTDTTLGQCILNADHRPGHITAASGDRSWCDVQRSGLRCVMAEVHIGHHVDIDGVRWGGCDQARVAGMELYPCVLEDGHEYSHRDQTGAKW